MNYYHLVGFDPEINKTEIIFSDYDRSVVKEEKDYCSEFNHKNLKIVKTNDDQESINLLIKSLN